MGELIRFNWQAFNPTSGTKVAIGFVVMIALTKLTGESWMAAGLAVLLAWITNVPGSLKNRVLGMLGFAAGAVAITLISGLIGLALWPNIILVSVVGLLGTLLLARGTRAYLVGKVLIIWAIFGPFLVDGTGTLSSVLAILVGTGVLIVLEAVAALPPLKGTATATAAESSAEHGMDFIVSYSITIALVLALTTYLGRALLETDATILVGAAFFVIGFEVHKTWVRGFARVIGGLAGASLGILISNLLGPGLLLDVIAIAAIFLCFATTSIHPGSFIFFLMLFTAIGWVGFESDELVYTFLQRLTGGTIGVLIAMVAVVLLQMVQNRRLARSIA